MMMQDSLSAEIPVKSLMYISLFKGIIEGGGVGYVATCGFALKDELTVFDAASAIAGFVLSTKDMAFTLFLMLFQFTGVDMSRNFRPAVLTEFRPRIVLQALRELADFSVCSRVLHPVAILSIYAATGIVIERHIALHWARLRCWQRRLVLMPMPIFQFQVESP